MTEDSGAALPVLAYRDRIVATLRRERRLIVSAPPGSGKSTCIPPFFLDPVSGIEGKIIVLQPRRIAARALAAYGSRALGERPGATVGYQVRFETCAGRDTRLMYMTCGVFMRRLLADPLAAGTGLVVLDEFHERTLEMDLILAWMRHLHTTGRTAPAFIVMSATLEKSDRLARYLDSAPVIDIPARAFPVTVSHQPPRSHEPVEQQALRALQGIAGTGMDGSVLVFMPGMGEIRRTAELAGPLCRGLAIPVRELHGRLPLDEQMAVLDESARRPCVIVATNVAETSLTIPGVTAVIDCGFERRAGYDPLRNRNTLYRAAICMGSATQRAGRAGRTAPGRCIRLWSAETEKGMPEAVVPEIRRLELSAVALHALGLLHRSGSPGVAGGMLEWLEAPEPARWEQAVRLCRDIGAAAQDGERISLTQAGAEMLFFPVDPLPAAILCASRRQGCALLSCAVIALWDGGGRPDQSADLLDQAFDLAAGERSAAISRETRQAYEALCALCDTPSLERERAALAAAAPDDRAATARALSRCWMGVLRMRIAVQEGSGARYVFADGSGAVCAAPRPGAPLPEALLALTLNESAGSGRARRNTVSQYLPLCTAWIAEAFSGRVTAQDACSWDEQRQCVVAERTLTLDGMVLERRPAAPDPQAAAALLAGRLASREIDLFDEEVLQLSYRVKCAAAAFPDRGLPKLDKDDWDLVFHELAAGKASRKELENASLIAAVREYLGPAHAAAIDRLAPVRMKLPSGKTGRITYYESSPPELSARITDLWGLRGSFTVCDGRTAGVFDILAPNMRTVQKTADLAGFWKNTYPGLKNALQRKYPRHPWP